MRQIGQLPDEQQARLFGDYLFTQKIPNQVEHEHDGSWLVWVHDDEQLDIAAQHLAKFRQNPGAPEFGKAAGATARQIAAEEEENIKWRRRFHDRTRVFPGTKSYRPGPLTFGLIVVCVVVGIFTRLGSDMSAMQPFFISSTMDRSMGLFPEVRNGEIWRLFTPVLLHFGILHLLFNMLWLFQLGSMIESQQGQLRLAVLIVSIAVISNVAQYVIVSPAFGGMSGVVYGLFGYIWVRGKLDPGSGLYLDQRTVLFMMIWFVLCFTGVIGHVANYVHAGGLIVGAAFGGVSGWWANQNPR